MVSSHRACGFAAGAALLPVSVRIFLVVTRSNAGDIRDKVAAGINPAAKAMLVK